MAPVPNEIPVPIANEAPAEIDVAPIATPPPARIGAINNDATPAPAPIRIPPAITPIPVADNTIPAATAIPLNFQFHYTRTLSFCQVLEPRVVTLAKRLF